VFPLFLLLGYNSMSSVEDPTDDKLVLRGMKNMKNLNYFIYIIILCSSIRFHALKNLLSNCVSN
jgi:hypothetical protein